MSHPSPVPILASNIHNRSQLNSPPIPSFPRQQSWASKDFAGPSSAGWTTSGMSMSPSGVSPIAAGMVGMAGSSQASGSVWAPSGSWRGEGWQGITAPPASPSALASQLPLAMSYHSASSPFRQSSFLPPASPAMSQDLEMSMSVDSMPSSLPRRSHSEMGSLLSQHNAFGVAREGSFGSGGFTGPASIERLSKLEQNFTSNYICCGIRLKGLHDLLEHYEESHVLVGANAAGGGSVPNGVTFQKQAVVPRSTSVSGITPAISTSHFATSTPPNLQPLPQHSAQTSTPSPTTDSDAPHTPGMMDLEMDDAILPSPFPHPARSVSMTGPSPWSSASALATTDTAIPQCVPPSLLTYSLPSRSSSTPANATSSALGASSSSGLLVGSGTPSTSTKKKAKKEAASDDVADGTVEINVSSGGGGEKRFRCPVEGCGKVYKQQNGLKYHLQRSINSAHGRVNGTITPSGTVVLTPQSANATPMPSASGSPVSEKGTSWSGATNGASAV